MDTFKIDCAERLQKQMWAEEKALRDANKDDAKNIPFVPGQTMTYSPQRQKWSLVNLTAFAKQCVHVMQP